MKKAKIAVATVFTSEARTTFSGAIIGIDQAQRTITFQTSTGQTWTTPVADSNILKHQIAKGDRVMIDVEVNDSDLSQRITKITKIPRGELFEPPLSPEAIGP